MNALLLPREPGLHAMRADLDAERAAERGAVGVPVGPRAHPTLDEAVFVVDVQRLAPAPTAGLEPVTGAEESAAQLGPRAGAEHAREPGRSAHSAQPLPRQDRIEIAERGEPRRDDAADLVARRRIADQREHRLGTIVEACGELAGETIRPVEIALVVEARNRDVLTLTGRIPCREEPEPLPHDRSADAPASVPRGKVRGASGGERTRIDRQQAIGEEAEGLAVERVSSRGRHRVDDAAACASELGLVSAGAHLDRLHQVVGQARAQHVPGWLDHVHTVDVVARLGPAGAPDVRAIPGVRDRGVRQQGDQRLVIALVGEQPHRCGVEPAAENGGVGVHARRCAHLGAGDRHRRRGERDHAEIGVRAQRDRHVVEGDPARVHAADADFVPPDRQQGKGEAPARIALGLATTGQRHAGHEHVRARDRSARGIADDARDRTGDALRSRRPAGQQDRQEDRSPRKDADWFEGGAGECRGGTRAGARVPVHPRSSGGGHEDCTRSGQWGVGPDSAIAFDPTQSFARGGPLVMVSS